MGPEDLRLPVELVVLRRLDALDLLHEAREFAELGPLVVCHPDRHADVDRLHNVHRLGGVVRPPAAAAGQLLLEPSEQALDRPAGRGFALGLRRGGAKRSRTNRVATGHALQLAGDVGHLVPHGPQGLVAERLEQVSTGLLEPIQRFSGRHDDYLPARPPADFCATGLFAPAFLVVAAATFFAGAAFLAATFFTGAAGAGSGCSSGSSGWSSSSFFSSSPSYSASGSSSGCSSPCSYWSSGSSSPCSASSYWSSVSSAPPSSPASSYWSSGSSAASSDSAGASLSARFFSPRVRSVSVSLSMRFVATATAAPLAASNARPRSSVCSAESAGLFWTRPEAPLSSFCGLVEIR